MKTASPGVGTMTLVIKTVKGKKYVYEQYRHGDVVVTKYLGPLEEMVRIYQLYKSLGKVQKLSKRDIRRLAKTLLQEYDKAIVKAVEKLCVVNSTGNGQEASRDWWARGDLNPGPPPCEGGVLTRLDDGPSSSPLFLATPSSQAIKVDAEPHGQGIQCKGIEIWFVIMVIGVCS